MVIKLKKHDIFVRDKFDIFCQVPISFSQAALGVEISVPTLEGTADLKIPEGTQSGSMFTLEKKGIINSFNSIRGNQYIKIFVETPVKLTPLQKELFLQLDKLESK